MLVRWAPAHPGAVAVTGGVTLRAGREYDLSTAEVTRLLSTTDGVGGGPCLIPVNPPGYEAAAEFIAAISAPTALNPETPPAAASAPAEPVKRTRGRKPKG